MMIKWWWWWLESATGNFRNRIGSNSYNGDRYDINVINDRVDINVKLLVIMDNGKIMIMINVDVFCNSNNNNHDITSNDNDNSKTTTTTITANDNNNGNDNNYVNKSGRDDDTNNNKDTIIMVKIIRQLYNSYH